MTDINDKYLQVKEKFEGGYSLKLGPVILTQYNDGSKELFNLQNKQKYRNNNNEFSFFEKETTTIINHQEKLPLRWTHEDISEFMNANTHVLKQSIEDSTKNVLKTVVSYINKQ